MKNLVGPRIRELRYRRGNTVTQAQLAAWREPGVAWYSRAMEHNEISIQEVRVFQALAQEWSTSTEIHLCAQGAAARTVRAHLKKLVEMGIADQAEVFPGHRYRLSELAAKRNIAYLLRLRKAVEVFGPS